MRMSGFILFNPIFSRENVTSLFKAGLILTLTIIIFTTQEPVNIEFVGFLDYLIAMLKELAIGLALGFIVSLFSFVIVWAGDIIDMQMGLSMAKVFDPQTNTSISLSGTIFNTLYMIFFFVTNVHIVMIEMLLTSYEVLPYGEAKFTQDIALGVMELFYICMELGTKLALPFIGTVFVSSMGMGLLMKAIPQINIFVIDIQWRVILGLLLILTFLSPVGEYLQDLLRLMLENTEDMLQLL